MNRLGRPLGHTFLGRYQAPQPPSRGLPEGYPPPAGLIFLPAVIAIQLALSLGLGFIGAALNVFYRDVKHIIALVIQVWLYATPIIYPASAVPSWLRPYYYLNPMTGIIESYRDILLRQQGPGSYLLVSLGMASALLVIGYWFFKRVEFQFADVV